MFAEFLFMKRIIYWAEGPASRRDKLINSPKVND